MQRTTTLTDTARQILWVFWSAFIGWSLDFDWKVLWVPKNCWHAIANKAATPRVMDGHFQCLLHVPFVWYGNEMRSFQLASTGCLCNKNKKCVRGCGSSVVLGRWGLCYKLSFLGSQANSARDGRVSVRLSTLTTAESFNPPSQRLNECLEGGT